MCGIWARINRLITCGTSCDCSDFDYDIELNHRGPDSFSEEKILDIQLIGCVLHLRGSEIVKQPIRSENIWLLWNGELYGNNLYGTDHYELEKNDTEQILKKLEHENPLKVFGEIEGCFAFVVVKDDEVWFGRDFLGKRSLIISRCSNSYTISSIGPGTQVPTGGIFKISLITNACSFIPWEYSGLCIPSSIRFSTIIQSPITFVEALEESVRLRLLGYGEIAVLFSGGLDCTVLAALAHKYVEPRSKIYLLNVAFIETAPDRGTGISSYRELRSLFPERRFRLILIDVSEHELELHKPRIIKLMGKNDTRMDYSIVAALYFASRGEGIEYETREPIRFPGKILLSGMGADEIFGGYSRYKSAFKHYGDEGVIREMCLDIDRLWHRNLGRDDRATSCHGRELRFPYLDTLLWQSLSFLPLNQVTQPQVPGKDKLLLRDYARSIGLTGASDFKKRAIQFGTRISQICNVKDFGSNRKAKGWQSINIDKEEQLEKEIKWCCKELEKKLEETDEKDKEKILKSIEKLKSDKIKIKDKRHIMRVYLGDYISIIDEGVEED